MMPAYARKAAVAWLSLSFALLTVAQCPAGLQAGPMTREAERRNTVSGIARDESGRPLAGVQVRVCPQSMDEVVTDSDGRFTVRWELRDWARSDKAPFYVMGRHFERNLAGSAAIQEGLQSVDLTLSPGAILAGTVNDNHGRPLAGARLSLWYRSTSVSVLMPGPDITTDAQGRYEVNAIAPGHTFVIHAGAAGYGRMSVQVHSDDAQDRRVVVEPLILAQANQTVAGRVVDARGQPVPGASVSVQGSGQPGQEVRTDAQGRFKIQGVCAGPLELYAYANTTPFVYGRVESAGGAEDVTVVVYEDVESSSEQQPASLMGQRLPDLKSLGQATAGPDLKGRRLLVCFLDVQQRPSRNCLQQLSTKAQQLRAADIVVIVVQAAAAPEAALQTWMRENNVPFAAGMIPQEQEKTRLRWGVRSLPWLILTVKKHVVVAEGFAVAELDAKIEDSADQPVTLETLRQRVARNEALIDPIKLSYTVKLTRTGELPPLVGGRTRGRSYSHYNITWAQNDSRQYLDSHIFFGPNEPARRELTILDGRTRTRVDLPDKMRASIGSASRTGWYRILTAKLRLRPFEDHRLLSEVLVPPRAVLHEGTQTIGNRLVHVVDVTQLYPYSCLRLWIDPEAGIPLRACDYDQHPSVPQALPTVEVNDITLHQLPNGGWIPVTGVRAFHLRRGDTTYNSYERICVDVNSIVTESDDVPDSLFRADLPDGASIYDALSGMTTVKGQPLKTYEQIVQGNGRFIAGTVADANGVPVAGVVAACLAIETVPSDGRPGSVRLVQPYERISARTDAKGRFALEVEQEGNHWLAFYHEDFVDQRVRGVSPDEHDLKVTLERGGTITGRVFGAIDGKKNPLADVHVFVRAGDSVVNRSMRPRRTMPTTDAEGRFEVRGLPTQMRDRSVASSEPPRYVPLPWRVSCGSASQSITFDRDGQTRAVELVLKPNVRMAASLVGRPMPDLNGLGLSVAREQLENRRVLVCFFDMEQRPARNCLEELAGRAAALKDRGVAVLAVHEKGIDVDKLQAWAKESGVTFVLGIVAADPDEVKFAWSVRSLPWLILTDTRHVVRAEGFAIDELDAKMREEKDHEKP